MKITKDGILAESFNNKLEAEMRMESKVKKALQEKKDITKSTGGYIIDGTERSYFYPIGSNAKQ